MRAAMMNAVGDEALEVVDDIEVVAVGAGEVKVKIEATGVCHSDLSGLNGTIPQPAPAVLGHEGAGVIVEVGEGVTSVAVGDHVIVAWSPPCGSLRQLHRPQVAAPLLQHPDGDGWHAALHP